MTTYDEASGMPFTDVLTRYQVLENRGTMSGAIRTLRVRGEQNDDRSPGPEDHPPLTAAEHLEMLALGEVIACYYRHPSQVHHTVMAGATWEQIAAAAGGDPGQARQAYWERAEGQRQLRGRYSAGGRGGRILDPRSQNSQRAAPVCRAATCPPRSTSKVGTAWAWNRREICGEVSTLTLISFTRPARSRASWHRGSLHYLHADCPVTQGSESLPGQDQTMPTASPEGAAGCHTSRSHRHQRAR